MNSSTRTAHGLNFSFFIILAELLAVGSYGSFRDDLKTEVYLIEVGSWKTLEDFPFGVKKKLHFVGFEDFFDSQ